VHGFPGDRGEGYAGVVRQLNAAGVPVVEIPLLPRPRATTSPADNAGRAAGGYQQFKE
jgi:hypothetical protein